MLPALRHRAFRRLAIIYVAVCVLEWFGSIALMVLVYDATGSAVMATCMLLAKQVVPGLVIPSFGSLLDQADLRRSLAVALAGSAGALAVVAFTGYGLWLFPLVALAGGFTAIARASLRAGFAVVLVGDLLRGGNAVINVAVAGSGTLGPALAALVVTSTGTTAALGAGAAGLLLLVVFAVGLPALPRDLRSQQAREGSVLSRSTALSSGWLLGLAAFAICALAMDEPALLAFSEQSLGSGVGGYGALYVAWGVGLAVGSVLFARALKSSMLGMSAAAGVVAAVGYLGMGLAPTVSVACAFAVVGGIGNGVGWVAIVTAIQEAAPTGCEARIATRIESIGMVGPGVGIVLGGVVAEADPRLALIVPGAAVLFAVAIGFVAAHRLPGFRTPTTLLPHSTSGGRA